MPPSAIYRRSPMRRRADRVRAAVLAGEPVCGSAVRSDRGGIQAYKKIGFVETTKGTKSGGMVLDLNTDAAKALWTPLGGNRYKLTAAVAMGYLTNG